MAKAGRFAVRRTNADDVFDQLYKEIVTLVLHPGTKMSEVEIAERFGVSRQPVREAFSRLVNLNLLLVRPQKATVIRGFSSRAIENARFTRAAVEEQVLRKASQGRQEKYDALIERNLSQQKQAVGQSDVETFHKLDYEFHRLLCCAADCEFAFQTIAENKAQIDRLCVLSLAEIKDVNVLYHDHLAIFTSLKAGDENRLVADIRAHLRRLDTTIEAVRREHKEYFED